MAIKKKSNKSAWCLETPGKMCCAVKRPSRRQHDHITKQKKDFVCVLKGVCVTGHKYTGMFLFGVSRRGQAICLAPLHLQ